MKIAKIAALAVLIVALAVIITLRMTAQPAISEAPEINASGLHHYAVPEATPEAAQDAPQPSEAVSCQTASTAPENAPCAATEPQTSSSVPLSEELQRVLLEACKEYGIDYAVMLALIQTESNFDPYVVSCSGCYGLCQLNPYYFPANLSPADNIRHGVRYLAKNLYTYGDYAAALCAYNCGHDTGARGYANTVLTRAENWRGVFG